MKVSLFITILPCLGLAAILEERQACYQDDCLRAVNGTRRGPSHPATGTSNCINFMTTSVLVDPVIAPTTATVRTTITGPLCSSLPLSSTTTTDVETTQGSIPFYATSACPSERYSSVCSCLGVTPGTITTTSATITRTVTSTFVLSGSGSCPPDIPTDTSATSAPPTSVSNTTLTSAPPTSVSNTTLTSASPTTDFNTTLTSAVPTTELNTTVTSASPTTELNTTVTSAPSNTTGFATTSVITMSFNSSTSTTVITFTSGDGGGPGTGTGTGTAPPGTGTIPSGTGTIPSGTGLIPSGTGLIPSGTGLIPSGTDFIPIPSDSSMIPSGTGLIPSGTGIPSDTMPPTTTSCTESGPPFANCTSTSIPSSFSRNETISFNSTTPPTATTPTATDTTATDTTNSELPTPTCLGLNVEACNGTCTDISVDTANCGGCGIVCPSDNTCTNGVCTRPPCDSTCGFIRACGPANSTCICGTDVDGNGVCFSGTGFCEDFEECDVTGDCPLGSVCIKESCCTTGDTGLCLRTEGCLNSLSLPLSRPITRAPRVGEGAGRTLAGLLRLDGEWV